MLFSSPTLAASALGGSFTLGFFVPKSDLPATIGFGGFIALSEGGLSRPFEDDVCGAIGQVS